MQRSSQSQNPINRINQILSEHTLNNFDGSRQKALHYYFKLTQKLYLENIYLEVDIAKNQKSINNLEEKLKMLAEDEQNNQMDMKRDKSSQNNQIASSIKPKKLKKQLIIYPDSSIGFFVCLHEKCGRNFCTKRQLNNHQILKHNFKKIQKQEGAIFQIQFMQSQEEDNPVYIFKTNLSE